PAGGVRPYQTALADAQSRLVLHTAETPQGTEPGAPGLVTISQLSVEGPRALASAFAQVTDVAACPAVANVLPLAVVEKAFSGLEQAAQLAQDSALVQPGAILTADSGEHERDLGVRDLALLQASARVGETAEWLPEDLQSSDAGRPVLSPSVMDQA